MTAILEPRSGRRDVVRRGLALRLDQERQLVKIPTVPSGEGLQQLEPFTGGRNLHHHRIAILSRRDEAFFTLRKPLRRELFTLRRLELDGLSLRRPQRLVHRIEAELALEGVRRHDLRAGEKRER